MAATRDPGRAPHGGEAPGAPAGEALGHPSRSDPPLDPETDVLGHDDGLDLDSEDVEPDAELDAEMHAEGEVASEDGGDPASGAPPRVKEIQQNARTIGIQATRLRSAELFGELRADGASESTRHGAREGLVHLHLPLVEHCARRFRNRGEPFEDLVQVGTIGLLKSIDRFDLERGVEFSTYATPTIIGEIKRHFRDKGWAIRVPRRLQELRMQITATTAELTQSLGRSPTVSELAHAIGCTAEEVVEGIESSNAYSTLSLDASDNSEDSKLTMLDTIGVDDENLAQVEVRESLKPLLDELPAREKKILLLRFFKNMTQSQIAAEIGVSQMHVSRLLARTLEQLRAHLQADD